MKSAVNIIHSFDWTIIISTVVCSSAVNFYSSGYIWVENDLVAIAFSLCLNEMFMAALNSLAIQVCCLLGNRPFQWCQGATEVAWRILKGSAALDCTYTSSLLFLPPPHFPPRPLPRPLDTPPEAFLPECGGRGLQLSDCLLFKQLVNKWDTDFFLRVNPPWTPPVFTSSQ